MTQTTNTTTTKSIHISGCKFSFYFAQKNLPFLFYTVNFTKHPYQSIYSTHLFNKIFILLPFFVISSLPLSPSQTQPPSSSLPDQQTNQDQTNPTWMTITGIIRVWFQWLGHAKMLWQGLWPWPLIVLGCKTRPFWRIEIWEPEQNLGPRKKLTQLALMFCFSNYRHSLSPIWCQSSEFFMW